MLENWPTTGQDSAWGMDEVCSFRSCGRKKINVTITQTTQQKHGYLNRFLPSERLLNKETGKVSVINLTLTCTFSSLEDISEIQWREQFAFPKFFDLH